MQNHSNQFKWLNEELQELEAQIKRKAPLDTLIYTSKDISEFLTKNGALLPKESIQQQEKLKELPQHLLNIKEEKIEDNLWFGLAFFAGISLFFLLFTLIELSMTLLISIAITTLVSIIMLAFIKIINQKRSKIRKQLETIKHPISYLKHITEYDSLLGKKEIK